MKTRIGIIFAGALAFAMLSGHGEAFARPGGWHGGGGHGWQGGGGHGWRGGGWHRGGWHGGGWRGPVRPGWGRPVVWRPHVRPYGWYGPRRVFAPAPVFVAPGFGYGVARGCSVRRSVGFAPGGWRRIVTVRTCYVR